MPLFLSILGSTIHASARPAAVFMPHLERIQSSLPSGLEMRLPTAIPLSGHSDIEESQLVVRVFQSETPQRLTVSVFTCEQSSHPCLLGSFSVERKTAVNAMRELERHQSRGDRITLTDNVKGYLIEGPSQNPPYQFSTVMWQQNDMIYTISFPANERESLVVMAISMAREQPLAPLASRPVS
ncbi:MAG: hypothetical protein F6K28_55835 [Microcoleus sp. SIO2G3]|nr:hypothetical protein [Microcoleus sp. SIO2G3]